MYEYQKENPVGIITLHYAQIIYNTTNSQNIKEIVVKIQGIAVESNIQREYQNVLLL